MKDGDGGEASANKVCVAASIGGYSRAPAAVGDVWRNCRPHVPRPASPDNLRHPSDEPVKLRKRRSRRRDLQRQPVGDYNSVSCTVATAAVADFMNVQFVLHS